MSADPTTDASGRRSPAVDMAKGCDPWIEPALGAVFGKVAILLGVSLAAYLPLAWAFGPDRWVGLGFFACRRAGCCSTPPTSSAAPD